MNRLTKVVSLGCMLGLLPIAGGCRSFRAEKVPPEQPYVMDSSAPIEMTPPPVGFSSEPAARPFPAAATDTSMPTPGLGATGADPLPGMPGLMEPPAGSGFDSNNLSSPAPLTPLGGAQPR
jgi:hypothetical protein